MQPGCKEYFLWPTRTGLRLLTPWRVLDLPCLQPPVLPAPVPFQADASSWWPDFPWREFEFGGDPCALWLDEALPDEWHLYPFERFWEAGHPLEHALEVVRLARTIDVCSGAATGKKALVLDRWPDTTFLDALQPLVAAGRVDIWRGCHVDHRLAGRPDLSHYALLILLAHGGEGSILLTDETGVPWLPQFPDGLPDTVWLATCSDHLDELLVFVRQAMSCGAHRVLAAEGYVSAGDVASRISTVLDQPSVPVALPSRIYGGTPFNGDDFDQDVRQQLLRWARNGESIRIELEGSLPERLRDMAHILDRMAYLPPLARSKVAEAMRGQFVLIKDELAGLAHPVPD